MGDLRRSTRLTYNGKINMTWSDEKGNSCSRHGDCMNLSSSGLKVKLDTQIPTRTVVTVKAKELALHGSASVRSCTRVGVKFEIGLEFVGGMRWQVPTSLLSVPG